MMGRNKETFYKATLREITEDINTFLEIKGMKKPDENICDYDLEGV